MHAQPRYSEHTIALKGGPFAPSGPATSTCAATRLRQPTPTLGPAAISGATHGLRAHLEDGPEFCAEVVAIASAHLLECVLLDGGGGEGAVKELRVGLLGVVLHHLLPQAVEELDSLARAAGQPLVICEEVQYLAERHVNIEPTASRQAREPMGARGGVLGVSRIRARATDGGKQGSRATMQAHGMADASAWEEKGGQHAGAGSTPGGGRT